MNCKSGIRRIFWTNMAALILAAVCHAQAGASGEIVKWDDYTYKFGPGGQMAQVLDADGKVVGSILMMSGELKLIPLPGTDSSKAQKSFDDWKAFRARSHGGLGASGGAPCPANFTPNYFDGTSWKPMTTVVSAGRETGVSIKEGLKNPIKPNAGYTRIAMYKDAAASITVGARPKFCIALPANVNPEVLEIGYVDVKKDHRELELTHSDRTWMPSKRIVAVDIKRISDTAVEITPKEPLPAGQYVLGGPPTVGIYDFGVDAGKTP